MVTGKRKNNEGSAKRWGVILAMPRKIGEKAREQVVDRAQSWTGWGTEAEGWVKDWTDFLGS